MSVSSRGIPTHMPHSSGLRPGDILLFRPTKKGGFVESFIHFTQSFINKKEGHDDTMHVAICVQNNNGIPIIAHLTESSGVLGYKREPLTNMNIRQGGDRPFIVYRPKDTIFANRIAQNAGDVEQNKNIKWKLLSGLASFVQTAHLDPDRKIKFEREISMASHCSKFATQIIKKSATQNSKEMARYYPNIRSSCTPKTLENYLYNNENYTQLVYTGKDNPYKLIKVELQKQIDRQEKKTDPKSKAKHQKLKATFNHAVALLDPTKKANGLQKAILLLKKVSPILNINTGKGLKTAESYGSVKKYAQRMGIFENYYKDALAFQKSREQYKNMVKKIAHTDPHSQRKGVKS